MIEAAILKETKDTNLIIFISIPSILKMVPNLESERREREREGERERGRERENKREKPMVKTKVSIHSVTYNSTSLCSSEEFLLIIPANVAKRERERERIKYTHDCIHVHVHVKHIQ